MQTSGIMLIIVLAIPLFTSIPREGMAEMAEDRASGPNKGLTFQDIGRGLQSAANNIGNEIPKIAPGIGNFFKTLSGKGDESESKAKPEESKPKK